MRDERPSITSSMLISSFKETEHQFQLENDRYRMTRMQNQIRKRRNILNIYSSQEQEQSFNNAIQLSQMFKTVDHHKIPLQQLQKRFRTNLKTGLTSEQAQKRLRKNGPNKVSQHKNTHWFIKFLYQLATPFGLLLWLAAILCCIAYGLFPVNSTNLYLGVVLILINLITGFITYYQKIQSQSLMESFKDFIPSQSTVIRDGYQMRMDSTRLVVGDIVKIQLGHKIHADMRVIQSRELKVDNSILTGESQLVLRTNYCTNDNPLQTKNIVFFSNLVKQGIGKGVVIATGDNTLIGIMTKSNRLRTVPVQQSSLKKQIKRFSLRLTIFTVVICILVFVIGFAVRLPAILTITCVIGIIIANVPEGFILQVYVGLTLTAKRLAEKKILCKSIDDVMTLGSVSCICTGKTGTLTQNKMTVANLWYSGSIKKGNHTYKKELCFTNEYDINDPGFISLHQCAVVSSFAKFDRSFPVQRQNVIKNNCRLDQIQKYQKLIQQRYKWQQQLKAKSYLDMPITGDNLQRGLIRFFQTIEDITITRQKYPVARDFEGKQCRLPFNSTNKYAFSINQYKTDDSFYCIFTKGAPQRIWKLCTHVDVGGKPVPKTPQWDKMFEQANQKFGRNGEKVAGFAKYHLSKKEYPYNFKFYVQNQNFEFEKQCFVGIISLSDNPQKGVPQSVLRCRSAGIKVVMITGDQPVTAISCARQCNIVTEQTVNEIAERTGRTFDECFQKSKAILIHGDELIKFSLQEEGLSQNLKGRKLQKLLTKDQVVFARIYSYQKLQICKVLQRMREVVAVTGENDNECAAIKKADIGIASGNGSDNIKDFANIILLNDDFNLIVVGIEQGRRIFDNLKKSICYVLTSQATQMYAYIGFIILQFPLPITPVILLCIALITDILPAISFAYQPRQIDLMTRPPRRKQEHLVSMKLISQAYGFTGWTQFLGCLLSYYVVANDFGFPPSELQFKAAQNLILPRINDQYNPTAWNFGNSNLSSTTCDNLNQTIDWIYVSHANLDLRLAAVKCKIVDQKPIYYQIFNWGECNVNQISLFTNLPICYTTEGIKYAQSSFFYSLIICQIFNTFICKTQRQSLFRQGKRNMFMIFAITVEILLVILMAYFKPFNIAFGTRDNIFMHSGITVIPFALMGVFMSEIQRLLIRKLPNSHWFVRAFLW